MKGYHEVPGRILKDVEEAAAWAREAWSLPRGKARKPRRPIPAHQRSLGRRAVRKPR
jgi:hypothetical protein